MFDSSLNAKYDIHSQNVRFLPLPSDQFRDIYLKPIDKFHCFCLREKLKCTIFSLCLARKFHNFFPWPWCVSQCFLAANWQFSQYFPMTNWWILWVFSCDRFTNFMIFFLAYCEFQGSFLWHTGEIQIFFFLAFN